MTKTTKTVRLNRFIANSGLCTRREADELIKKGEIAVNDKVEKTLGVQVRPGVDKVEHLGRPLAGEVMRFILMNKPRAYVVEGKGGKSIFALMHDACEERVYPVSPLGVLDVGLQLFTNDKELITRIKKNGTKETSLYHITFSEPISDENLDRLRNGVKLGRVRFAVKEVILTDEGEGKAIGLMPIVDDPKRIKEALRVMGLKFEKFDRVLFSGLTKKNLSRGKWRALSDKEVAFLRMGVL